MSAKILIVEKKTKTDARARVPNGKGRKHRGTPTVIARGRSSANTSRPRFWSLRRKNSESKIEYRTITYRNANMPLIFSSVMPPMWERVQPLTLSELQSRFGDKPLKFQVICTHLSPKRDCSAKSTGGSAILKA